MPRMIIPPWLFIPIIGVLGYLYVASQEENELRRQQKLKWESAIHDRVDEVKKTIETTEGCKIDIVPIRYDPPDGEIIISYLKYATVKPERVVITWNTIFGDVKTLEKCTREPGLLRDIGYTLLYGWHTGRMLLHWGYLLKYCRDNNIQVDIYEYDTTHLNKYPELPDILARCGTTVIVRNKSRSIDGSDFQSQLNEVMKKEYPEMWREYVERRDVPLTAYLYEKSKTCKNISAILSEGSAIGVVNIWNEKHPTEVINKPIEPSPHQ